MRNDAPPVTVTPPVTGTGEKKGDPASEMTNVLAEGTPRGSKKFVKFPQVTVDVASSISR